jgi:hypothetical protein
MHTNNNVSSSKAAGSGADKEAITPLGTVWHIRARTTRNNNNSNAPLACAVFGREIADRGRSDHANGLLKGERLLPLPLFLRDLLLHLLLLRRAHLQCAGHGRHAHSKRVRPEVKRIKVWAKPKRREPRQRPCARQAQGPR